MVQKVLAHLGQLYKTLVFLIFLAILSNLIKSNELRTSILEEVKIFNSDLALLNTKFTIFEQQNNLEEAVLAYGATIAFIERSDSIDTNVGGD